MVNPSNEAMIIEAFNSQTIIQDRLDVQHTPLYDTVTLAAGASVTQLATAFFTNVGPASGKTYAQTNLTQAQKLTAPEAFSIFGFRIRWAENILYSDLLAVINGFAFEFYLGQKPYQRAPLWHFNAGGGPSGAFTTGSQSCLTNGVAGRESMHKLAIPIVIENQMTFFAQLVGTPITLATSGANGGQGLVLQVLLDGLYARGIQ